MRYIRKDARVHANSLCKRCGTAGGCGSEGCTEVTCLYCGTTQCSGNGLGNGQCKVCHYGFLPGWARSSGHVGCSYKGCKETPVGRFPHKGVCCARHGTLIMNRRTGKDYLAEVAKYREQDWRLVA